MVKLTSNTLLYVPDDVYPLIERYHVSEGDIIVSIVGSIGLVAYIDKKLDGANLTENAARITQFKNTEPKFVEYYLKSPLERGEIEANTVGSTQPKLPLYGIKNIRIVKPSLEEQRRIGTVLSWFDELIESKRRQNEVLEKVAMAIFKSWFIDFEPFQDEEFIYSEELDMEIPKGWEVKPISEVAVPIRLQKNGKILL